MRFLFKWTVIAGIFGGFIYYMNKIEDDKEREMQAQLFPYNEQISRYLVKKSVADSRIAAKGNVIFVNEKTRKVDKFSDYTIGPYNQPKSPNEVDSVVLHNCEYVQIDSYSNGSKALQQTCGFTVVDVASGIWSSWGEFKGTMPAAEIKRKRGSTSDERGGKAIYSFFDAGGLVTRRTAPQ